MEKNTKIENFGKIIGFGIALLIFVSILYYINSKSSLINFNISYTNYISIIIAIYVIILILMNFIKK